MKRHQYEGQSHALDFWFAKLGEEFGEVARELVDKMKEPSYSNGKLIKELGHVEFIARCFREDMEKRGA